MKAIKVTENNKRLNPEYLGFNSVGDIKEINRLPKKWRTEKWNCPGDFDKREDLQLNAGFYPVEIAKPQENEKLGEIYRVEGQQLFRIDAVPMTAEEIASRDAENARAPLETEKQLYVQRITDGQEAYAQISAEMRLAKLSGQMDVATHSFVETTLKPVRNEVIAGQWISAKEILEGIGAEFIGQTLYDDLHSRLSAYIEISYG